MLRTIASYRTAQHNGAMKTEELVELLMRKFGIETPRQRQEAAIRRLREFWDDDFERRRDGASAWIGESR